MERSEQERVMVMKEVPSLVRPPRQPLEKLER
jgi:hypothetical protein